ncbi:MAG TPA: hypothetical protein VFK05_37005 [Polyangiaceae bacterium]|nr:hypothetical protein [Polyangiaceae bacterium]
MDSKTHRRGPADTSTARFTKLLVVSALLHVPLTPWAALVGLLSLWSPPAEDSDAPPITGIPIDVIEDEPPKASAPEPPAPAEPAGPPAEAALVTPRKKPPKPVKTIVDAGAPDAQPADAEVDAGVADAGPLDAGSLDAGKVASDAGAGTDERDAGAIADAGPTSDAGAKPISDPSVVAGVKRVADPNANVRITLYTEKIRANPLGARIGPLLGSLYQWRDFFGPSGVDPIKDIDQIYIVGPQLRNSSNVVAILRHHLPPAKMHAAIDLLVRADPQGGQWLDAGVPVASAHADGAERRFVIANAQTVVVTPPSAFSAAAAAGKQLTLRPSKGPEAALIYLATPYRAFAGLAIKVPESIKWARIRITPSADGGASAELEAEDENADTASEDAAYLSRTTNALSQLNLGFLGSLLGQSSHRFIEHVAFTSEGNMIHGTARVTADQLQTALDMAGAFLSDRNTRRARPGGSAKPMTGGAGGARGR